jgi:hypothetical protein
MWFMLMELMLDHPEMAAFEMTSLYAWSWQFVAQMWRTPFVAMMLAATASLVYYVIVV